MNACTRLTGGLIHHIPSDLWRSALTCANTANLRGGYAQITARVGDRQQTSSKRATPLSTLGGGTQSTVSNTAVTTAPGARC